MSPLRISVARDVAGEIDVVVKIDGATVRGTLRDDDALSLVLDLSRLIDEAPTVDELRGEVPS